MSNAVEAAMQLFSAAPSISRPMVPTRTGGMQTDTRSQKGSFQRLWEVHVVDNALVNWWDSGYEIAVLMFYYLAFRRTKYDTAGIMDDACIVEEYYF
jgi:hypothetical protein